MLSSFAKLFRAPKSAPAAPAVPHGTRVYAIGDIHGCLVQFDALIAAIEADDARRGPAQTTMILLGDLVDRGPDSAGVVRRARDWAARRKVRHIAGNHEEMFLDSFEDRGTLKHFIKYGGRETILSYGVDPRAYRDASIEQTRVLMTAAVPAADREFLAAAEDAIEIGDYLFVHAGIQPDVPLDEQLTSDLRWIREPFLSHPAAHGPIVVHGHTITEDIELRPNRIGLDTGAYDSGRLTALGLEGAQRWLMEAALIDGAVRVTCRNMP
jgi:serine/threonine protein phosphatase 1